MEAIQGTLQSVFGAIVIFTISIAIVLAIVAFVLIEVGWVLNLYAELNRRWKASLQQTGKMHDRSERDDLQ